MRSTRPQPSPIATGRRLSRTSMRINVSSRRAERHANADLAATLTDDERRDTKKTDDGEHKRARTDDTRGAAMARDTCRLVRSRSLGSATKGDRSGSSARTSRVDVCGETALGSPSADTTRCVTMLVDVERKVDRRQVVSRRSASSSRVDDANDPCSGRLARQIGHLEASGLSGGPQTRSSVASRSDSHRPRTGPRKAGRNHRDRQLIAEPRLLRRSDPAGLRSRPYRSSSAGHLVALDACRAQPSPASRSRPSWRGR